MSATVARSEAGGLELADPWMRLARVATSPLKVWFSFRYEDLFHIPAVGPSIVACSHASYIDPFAYGFAVLKRGRNPRFLAKNELFRIPVVGPVLRGAGQIPVRRGTGDATPLQAAERALADGEVVVVYPEGTVTKRPDHLPMQGKTGVVRLSLATGVPIVPLASWGSQAVWQKSGRGSLKFGRPVFVKAGSPIDFTDRVAEQKDYDAIRQMTGQVMDELTALVVDIRDRYPRRWGDGAG